MLNKQNIKQKREEARKLIQKNRNLPISEKKKAAKKLSGIIPYDGKDFNELRHEGLLEKFKIG